MLTNDREEFENQLGRLCAGFNVPRTKHRVDAYWTGLAKMSLAQFQRAIDLALSETGPDEIPTAPQLWRILRGGRPTAPPAAVNPGAPGKTAPTVQEQLCAYAAVQGHADAAPATYVYREWFDATRPKGLERCAECVGLVIDLPNGRRLGWSVAAMLADTDGHARAMRQFQPGPLPTEAQIRAWVGIEGPRAP